jgi:hypothetical protein
MLRKRVFIILAGIFLTCGSYALTWVYPEHWDIFLLSVLKLDSDHRSILDQLWAQARKGHEQRLNESVIDATQNVNPVLIDYAAWPAIAGDHSTSPVNRNSQVPL